MGKSEAENEISLDIGWGKVAGKRHGDPGGRPLLALHGWLDNAASFDPLFARLPAHYQVVALDLPGHGYSDHRPAGTYYDFASAMIDVDAAVAKLGWDRFLLVGHSLGAGIASMMAGVWGNRVKGVVLIEGLGPFSWEAAEAPRRLRVFLEDRATLASKKLPVYADARAAADIRRKAGDLSQTSAEILIGRGLRPIEGGVTWRSDNRLRLPSSVRFTEAHVLAFLREIRCPALVIRAKSGMPFDPKIFSERAAVIDGLKLVELPGGHHLHLDDPDTVAPVLREFLDAIG